MAEEAVEVVQLHDNFYRDSYARVVFILMLMIITIASLVGISIYLYLDQPEPVYFGVSEDWRILPPVPLTEPYLSTPDLLQWVSVALPQAFKFDFIDYDVELKQAQTYFTENGWQNFMGQINIYANKKNIMDSKTFIFAKPAGAPILCNQGLLDGRYAWWIEMPVTLSYLGNTSKNSETLRLQALVVRTSTLNDLSGVDIDNVIVKTGGKVCF